jgi:hypothetical protein
MRLKTKRGENEEVQERKKGEINYILKGKNKIRGIMKA